LIGILQTPHRFRTKRQLWAFSGFGIETRSSADHRYVEGQLERSKKPASIRGLNEDYNHDLKNLGRDPRHHQAGSLPGVLHGFAGQRDEAGDGAPDFSPQDCSNHADCLEERSALRSPISETTKSLSVSDRIRSVLGISSGGGRWVLETLGFESESQPVS
jgi:hypothetical protein